MEIAPQLKIWLDAGKQRDEAQNKTFKQHEVKRGERVRLRVVEIRKLDAVLECETGAQAGRRISADRQRLQLWHAQPADIQHMNVGDEVVLEGEPSYISKHRMIGRIVEWRHK